jgi:DNA topoisomerase I
MARRGGWRRKGTNRFRYVDAYDRPITDGEALERIDRLVIPPAWKDVWISPNPRANLQATGVDRAGRRQYLYHPAYRAAQEERKYVSPAVVEQWRDGRTLEDFRERRLRVVTARGLENEEAALLSLLRSWRIRRSRAAA